MCEGEPTIEVITGEALDAARLAFQQRVSDYGYDPAHWDYRFTAWEVDSMLVNRLRRYEIEGECKE